MENQTYTVMVIPVNEAPAQQEGSIYATRALAYAALWAICDEERWQQSDSGHEATEYRRGGDGEEEVLRVVVVDNRLNRFEVSALPTPTNVI